MRPLFSLSTGAVALSLTVLLSACGGGGGGGDKLAPQPVGTLTFTGTSSGTFVVATSASQLTGSTIQVNTAGTPTFNIITHYETTGIAVTDVQVNVGSSSSSSYVGYACSATTTACNGMALDKAARTLTFTNATLQGASSTTVTINGTVTWSAPPP